MNKINFSLFAIFLLCSLQCCSNTKPIHIQLADKVRNSALAKIKKKYNLRISDIIDGLADCVNLSGASFYYFGEKTKDEARALIVPIVQDYLREFNENEEIRPYLLNYPFTLQNIDIAIFFRKNDGGDTTDPIIGVVSCYNGKIYYNTYGENIRSGYKKEYEETFEEAVAILNSQK